LLFFTGACAVVRLCGVMINVLHSTNEFTLGLVSTWMCDCWQTEKPSGYATNHPGQLSLAIPPW